MGKKQGDAQRVKGNAQPSSSSKAAEMLQQVAPNLTGLSTSMPPLGINNLLDDTFDSALDSEMRMVLKKLSKKDVLTKTKSLEELKALIDSKSNEDCIAIIPYWSKSYTKLSIENDRKIRELCQQVHEKLCTKVTKNIAPYLKVLMPYWILAQADSYATAARIAENSFKSTFNETKQPEVVNFTKDEILNVIHEYLLVETAKTLSDMKTTSQDEADQKYENIVSMSLRGLSLFIKYYFTSKTPTKESGDKASANKPQLDKLEKIFNDPKFWKFSKDQSMKIRVEFFNLLTQILDAVVFEKSGVLKDDEQLKPLVELLKSKIVPLVFYACDEENSQCASLIWSAMKRSIEEGGNNALELVNVRKAFLPKLIALLKAHANGNANSQNVETVYSGLNDIVSPVLRRVREEGGFDEAAQLGKDLMAKLFDSVVKDSSSQVRTRFGNDPSSFRSRKISAFFHCFDAVFNDLNDDSKSLEIFSNLISDYVIKLFDWYLKSNEFDLNKSIGFELEFEKFIKNVLEKQLPSNEADFSRVKESAWSEMSSILREKLERNEENLVRNFCSLFQSPDLVNNPRVKSLIELVFKHVLGQFKDANQKLEPLKNLNVLVKNLISFDLLDLILSVVLQSQQTDRLAQFNDVFIEDLVKNCLTADQLDSELLFEQIELFLYVNTSLGKEEETWGFLVRKLDHFMFDLANSNQLEQFLKEYLKGLKTKSIDSIIIKSVSEWISKSEKMSGFIERRFEGANESLDFASDAIELVSDLTESLQTKSEKSDHFQAMIVKKNRDFLQNAVSRPHDLKLEQLAEYLKFNKSFIRRKSSTLYLWSQLMNLLRLRQLVHNSPKIELGIQELSEDLISVILKESLTNNASKESNFDGLVEFIEENKSRSEFLFVFKDLLKIVENAVKKLRPEEDEMNEQWIKKFLIDAMFNQNNTSFRDAFESILFEDNNVINRRLLAKLYMSEDLNFLYSDQHSILIKPETSSTGSPKSHLNELSYILTLLSSYLKYKTDNNKDELLQPNVLTLEGNWFFIFASALLVDQFYPLDDEETAAVRSIKCELKNLVSTKNGAAFLARLHHYVLEQEEYIRHIEERFELIHLNHISFYLTQFVEFAGRFPESAPLLDALNRFALSSIQMILHFRGESISEEAVKFYLYDLSFAKQSVIGNLDSLSQNIDHYYSLFSGLLETTIGRLEFVASQLKSTNDIVELAQNLSQFNTLIDLTTKYAGFYMSMLRGDGALQVDEHLEARIRDIFNSSQTTLEFIRANLSSGLLKVIEIMIDLKASITNSKMFSPAGYFFYFDPSNSSRFGDDFEWLSMVLLDKLNSLLSLLFVDYRLHVTNANFVQQLSQYLKEKHWDFILCYSAELAQKIKFKHFEEKKYLYLLLASYSSTLDGLCRCMEYRVRDNRTSSYPNSIHSDWNGFFSKEIFDPLLVLFAQLCERTSDENRSNELLLVTVVERLGNIVAQIPFERLQLNELEPRLNVLDLDLNVLGLNSAAASSKKLPVLALTDAVKTLFNYFVPLLRHRLAFVQIASYRVLRAVMKEMSRFYDIRPPKTEEESELNEEEEDEEKTVQRYLNIIDSLPNTFVTTLSELVELFRDLKKTLDIDESLLIAHGASERTCDEDLEEHQARELATATNNKLISFMLVNKLVLDMFTGSSASMEFKVKLGNDMRERNLSDALLHALFRVMPKSSPACFQSVELATIDCLGMDELDAELLLQQLKSSRRRFEFTVVVQDNRLVEFLASKLFKYALKCVPAIVRDWWNMQPKRIADQVDKFTTRFVSPVLIEDEVKQVNRSANLIMTQTSNPGAASSKSKKYLEDDDEQSTIKIRGMLSTREIVSTYKMKELSMELVIQLPVNYPLGVVKVSSVKRIGVSENEWRNWLLQLTTYLSHQNGSICQGLQIWKRNVDKKFAGVEECTICYTVIHGTNLQLPKMKCRTCKKKFHTICLYKWFESSSKSTCPLCRNIF